MSENLECREGEGFLEARFLGRYALPSFKIQMRDSVEVARERKFTRVLANLLYLEGYFPSTIDRFEIGVYGGEISRNFRIAVLLTPEQWGDRLVTKVAQNRGVDIAPFTDRAAALQWLLETPPEGGNAAAPPG